MNGDLIWKKESWNLFQEISLESINALGRKLVGNLEYWFL